MVYVPPTFVDKEDGGTQHLDAATLNAMTAAIVAAGSAGSSGLTPTGVKTAPYTAVSGDLVRVDTTSGPVTVTLPAAATGGAPVGVKLVTLGGSNAVTIAAAGSDVFNKAGGVTTLTLSLLNQSVVLAPIAGVWVAQSDDLPLSQLDNRYATVVLPWATGTAYKAGQPITYLGRTYTAVDAHTASASFDTDRVAHWRLLPALGSSRLEILERQDLWTFGHSYPAGSGAGAWGDMLFGRHNMRTSASRSVAGTTAGAMADQIRQVVLASNGGTGASLLGLQTLQSLINDANSSYATATVVEAYRSAFAQLWGLRLGITTQAFAFGSGWTSGVTTTAGSFFDFSWVGDTAYLLVGMTTGAATSVSVKRSGTGGATAQTVNTGGYAYAFPGVIKLSGYGAGTHTVRVTLDSGAGLTVYFGLFANPGPGTVLWCPEGDIPSFDSTKNTLMTVTYRNAIAAIVPDFSNVVPVIPDASWDSSTMIYSDNVHLNSKGLLYWCRRAEEELSKLSLRQGQNFLTLNNNPGYNTPLPSATASYLSTTIDQTTPYTQLKNWSAGAGLWVYSNGTDFPASFPVGGSLVITGGTGWTPGTYQVNSVSNAFGTPDGTRNMLQLKRVPGPLGNEDTILSAAAGTAGGIGHLSL